jgi:hypothetical protein
LITCVMTAGTADGAVLVRIHLFCFRGIIWGIYRLVLIAEVQGKKKMEPIVSLVMVQVEYINMTWLQILTILKAVTTIK